MNEFKKCEDCGELAEENLCSIYKANKSHIGTLNDQLVYSRLDLRVAEETIQTLRETMVALKVCMDAVKPGFVDAIEKVSKAFAESKQKRD